MSQTTVIANEAPRDVRVRDAIASAAQRTGVAFDYLFNQAKIESGLKPEAKAQTSSAAGLFQFTRQTWLATVKENGAAHGLSWAADAIRQTSNGAYRVDDPTMRTAILNLRYQPEAASAMAAEFAGENSDFLKQRLGRAPEPVDLYLAHFLGAGGAASFLTAHDAYPDAPAAPQFAAAASANRAVFFRADGQARSFGEIRSRFAEKLGAEAGRPAAPSAIQIAPGPWLANASGPPRDFEPDPPRPLQLRGIEAMPRRLSIDFAHAAYQRLAMMSGGRVA
jgi:hypothetical protein